MIAALAPMVLAGAGAVVAWLVRSVEARLREAEGEGAVLVSEPVREPPVPRPAPPAAPRPAPRPVSCLRGPR